MLAAPPSGPLAGLLVADFSRVLAGPYCTMLLGDLGADVVKVESADGDDTRTWLPPTRDGVATYYLSVNRNKRSVALDLRAPGDLALAHELTRRADVTIQNFRPGGLVKYGLDYESVRDRRKSAVYCSISGFGAADGARLAGYDLLAQAVSGLMHLTGDPDGPPYRAGVAVFDVIAGLHAAFGILAALRHRDLNGEGQHVEVNLLSSALSGLVNQASAYVAGGVVTNRMGNGHLSLYPYDPFTTAEGELIVISGNDRQFRRLAEELGVPELADDERFATMAARNGHRDELRPLVEARLAERTAAEWFEILTGAGIACGPINDVRGGVELAERLGLRPVADAGGVPTIRHPVDFSLTAPRYDHAPPAVDEQGEEIRAWLAG